MTSLSYVLPIRTRPGDAPPDELTDYLRWLSGHAEVIVVDGSELEDFRSHRERWSTFVTHLPPDEDIRCRNGKVGGVLTGLRVAGHDLVVVADDDVRYDDVGLTRLGALLTHADLVRPQNHFDPLPWHARWDTARMLMNRSVASDHPGTLGVRRSFLRSIGGYDGDVLFENLELVRTVAAAGGRVVEAPDLFVRRRPPTLARFLEQRPRQAYDDWAQPLRFATFLATAPVAFAVARRRPGLLAAGAASIVLAASLGRIRRGGRRVFDPVSPWLAPLWVAERAILSWLALGRRVFGGGCPYAGTVIRRAATPPRELRRRFRTSAG